MEALPPLALPGNTIPPPNMVQIQYVCWCCHQRSNGHLLRGICRVVTHHVGDHNICQCYGVRFDGTEALGSQMCCCCRYFVIKHLLNHRSPLVPHKHWGFYIVNVVYHQLRSHANHPQSPSPEDDSPLQQAGVNGHLSTSRLPGPTAGGEAMQNGTAIEHPDDARVVAGRRPHRRARKKRMACNRPQLDSDGDSDFC